MEPVLCPFHCIKAFALPCLSKRATLKAPRCVFICPCKIQLWKSQPYIVAYKDTPWDVSVALFLTSSLKLRSSYTVKTKASSNAFNICVSVPLATLRGFQQKLDEAKLIIFLHPCKKLWKKIIWDFMISVRVRTQVKKVSDDVRKWGRQESCIVSWRNELQGVNHVLKLKKWKNRYFLSRIFLQNKEKL